MVVANNKINGDKKYTSNAGDLMAMPIRQCDAGCIAQWSASVASCKTTRCCHQVSARAVLPHWPPWPTSLNETKKTLTEHNFYLAFSR
jgi:hypothetical protein